METPINNRIAMVMLAFKPMLVLFDLCVSFEFVGNLWTLKYRASQFIPKRKKKH